MSACHFCSALSITRADLRDQSHADWPLNVLGQLELPKALLWQCSNVLRLLLHMELHGGRCHKALQGDMAIRPLAAQLSKLMSRMKPAIESLHCIAKH